MMTQQSKHTPGPDRVLVSSCKVFGEGVNNSIKYRGLYREFSETEYILATPAREAAPDLLEALERALNFIANTESEMGEPLECGDMARAAIAKAKGGVE